MRDQPGTIKAKEFISESTKKIKNVLISVSLLAYIIIKGGLIPSSISSFGITLSIENQNSIIAGLGCIVIYMVVQLIYRLYLDYINWKMGYYNTIYLKFNEDGHIDQDEIEGKFHVPGIEKKELSRFFKWVDWNIRTQVIVEIILPVIFGIFTAINIL